MKFFAFMASRVGRIVRGLLGLALVGFGIGLGGGWWALAIVGLVPLTAAAFDVCLFAPLAHLPAGGQSLRARSLTH